VFCSDETGKVFSNISERLDGATENHELSLQKHPMDSKTVSFLPNILTNLVQVYSNRCHIFVLMLCVAHFAVS